MLKVSVFKISEQRSIGTSKTLIAFTLGKISPVATQVSSKRTIKAPVLTIYDVLRAAMLWLGIFESFRVVLKVRNY